MLKSWSGKLTQLDPHRIPVFLGTVWGLAITLLMVDTNLSNPASFRNPITSPLFMLLAI